jgi:hypothetical protein
MLPLKYRNQYDLSCIIERHLGSGAFLQMPFWPRKVIFQTFTTVMATQGSKFGKSLPERTFGAVWKLYGLS